MPSKLSTGTKRRAPPSWCKAGTWLTIVGLIAGKPVKLAVYARWKQDICAINVDAIESFQLSYNPDTKDWTGASSDKGLNLAVEICSLAEKDRYDCELILRNGTTVLDSHNWSNRTIADVRPFDSKLLEHVVDSKKWFYHLHAKG